MEPLDKETAYRLHRRFDRIGRLVGDAGMGKLLGAHVMVVGLGGVGSFAVEALARSGVGRLSLVDFDRVCVTNTNRQLQAVATSVAKPKATMLAERVRAINPQATAQRGAAVLQRQDVRRDPGARAPTSWSTPSTTSRPSATFWPPASHAAFASCRRRARRAAWIRRQIRVVDLADTAVDPLADAVRRALRQKYDFPPKGPFGIASVYSTEPPATPHELHYDGGDGFRCVCPGGANEFHSCEERRIIYGTAGFVTGAFGLACASVVVRAIADSQ